MYVDNVFVSTVCKSKTNKKSHEIQFIDKTFYYHLTHGIQINVTPTHVIFTFYSHIKYNNV